MPGTGAPACPDCRGTGFVIVEGGGASRARPCACRSAAQPSGAASRLEAARVPPRYRECDFENFNCYGHAQQAHSLEQARSLAMRFVEEYPVDDRGLLIMGPPGVGKTHLAVATLRRLMLDKGVSCLFCDVEDLSRQIRSTFDRPSGPGEHDVLQPVLATEVVLLDDLGGRQLTPWLEETLAHIVTVRYNEKRVTLVTTNYLDEAGPGGHRPPTAGKGEKTRLTLGDRIGPRVRSRLHEMCHVLLIEAQDFRQAVKLADHQSVPEIRRGARSGP